VLWHVDDLKISQASKAVVSSVIDYLSKSYGEEAPQTLKRGKANHSLGMVLDYTIDGKVQISMNDYIEEVIKPLPEDMSGKSSTLQGITCSQ